MSNLASYSNRPPQPPRGDTIARYGTYAEAQKAVDYLSDNLFPVQNVTIVGVDLQMVERVIGRLTYSRVAVQGLLSGGYFGAFVGLLISIFGGAQGFSWAYAILLGAAFGMLYMVLGHAVTGGRRDFASTSQIVAGEYRVLCLPETAGRAVELLAKLAGEGGPVSRGPLGPGGGIGGGFGDPTATAPVTPVGPVGSVGPVSGAPAAPDGETAQAPAEPVTGPTYSEMIDRKKAEEKAAEEKARAERERSDREAY